MARWHKVKKIKHPNAKAVQKRVQLKGRIQKILMSMMIEEKEKKNQGMLTSWRHLRYLKPLAVFAGRGEVL
jgi:hypothetical protein